MYTGLFLPDLYKILLCHQNTAVVKERTTCNLRCLYKETGCSTKPSDLPYQSFKTYGFLVMNSIYIISCRTNSNTFDLRFEYFLKSLCIFLCRQEIEIVYGQGHPPL